MKASVRIAGLELGYYGSSCKQSDNQVCLYIGRRQDAQRLL